MIVLASASPRRSELLRNAQIPFRAHPAHVPEQPGADERPLDYARRLACDKATAIQAQFPNEFVLGADTIVIADEHLLEKPADDADASRMLKLLSGRTHQVTTGVCLLGPNGYKEICAETTQVTFQALSDEEIEMYVASGEPMDKAGAYGIQGIASRWVSGIQGCYFNVVGLPVPLVYRMMRQAGAL